MKAFLICILVAALAAAGTPAPVSAASAQTQAVAVEAWNETWPVDTWDPGYSDAIQLDKKVYPTGDTRIQADLSVPFGITGPVIVEIVHLGADSVVYYEETEKSSLSIAVNLQAGEYLLRVRPPLDLSKYLEEDWTEYWDEYWSAQFPTAHFSVNGPSNLLRLTGGPVADDSSEDFLMGVGLEWDGSANGGPYTVTRRDLGYKIEGETRTTDIRTCQFFDGDAKAGGVYSYTVSDGKRTSNPVVVDLTRFPPQEYAGNENDKVLVLKISDPNLYSAEKKEDASNPSKLTKLGKIDANNPGVVPIISNSRTMLPVATLVRTMGGSASWDGGNRIVTLKLRGNVLKVPINSKTVYLNNREQTVSTAARIEHSRTLVPLRMLELLGCEVDWIPQGRIAVISYEGD